MTPLSAIEQALTSGVPTYLVRQAICWASVGAGHRGPGAFRRFKHDLFDEHPDLFSVWHAFHNARANRRAVEWLLDQGLIRDDAARKFLVDHPDPDLP